jgi:enamine deaminase RidA (YjgF/YER057c/UK114 family)
MTTVKREFLPAPWEAKYSFFPALITQGGQGGPARRDFDAQVRQAFKNISRGRYSQRFTDLRKEFWPGDYPASTLIVAAGFALPQIMVEVTAYAVV